MIILYQNLLFTLQVVDYGEKKEEICLIHRTKTPIPPERLSHNTKAHQKYSNTQRLRTDLSRIVRVITATQLVWLTGLRAQIFQSPQQLCNQKDTYLKMCK